MASTDNCIVKNVENNLKGVDNMICFNCGKETEEYLCPDCRAEKILDILIPQMLSFKAELCQFPHLIEYVATLPEAREVRKCIPPILDSLSEEKAEYYCCLYYRYEEKEKLEHAIENYLSKHDWTERKSQKLIRFLLDHYIPNDFIKPRAWCDWIAETEGIYCELYTKAAEYYAMIAEYDLSDCLVEKGLTCDIFLYADKAKMQGALEKQKEKTKGYRTKKPYWPTTEERRRAVAMFYDEKGIPYPRIESKPKKVDEDKFESINECYDLPENYCAFWCAEAFSVSSAKPIYQIAAVKVENGKTIDEFQSFIRPWDGASSRKSAAKEAGVLLAVIEGAEDVDQVMVKFFDFVGDAVLVSTDALGNQKKLLCRAARYAGMKQLSNELYDLLDFAGETDSKFGLANRADLLEAFNITEGTDALGKARVNVALHTALKHYQA